MYIAKHQKYNYKYALHLGLELIYTRMYTIPTPGCTQSLHPDAKETRMGMYGNF